ncbi:MAG: DUF1854 domain-containing protein [Pirellulaceae bacterium]
MQELLSGPTRGTTAADSQVDLPSNDESSLSKIVLRQRTDISLDGQPQTQWLIATSSQLMVALERRNAEASLNAAETLEEVEPYVAVLRRIELADVESLRTTAGTGSGLLQARIDNNWVNVVRFSNSLADTFHHTGRGLEALKNGIATPESLHVETVKRCDKCQLRLGTSIESCPRCLHRSKIASRVWELIKPQINGTILLCVLTVIGVALELVPPKLQQIMVDQILSGPSGTIDKSPFFTALLIVVLSLAASRILLSFVGWIKGRLATRIGSSLTYNLRAQMVRRLQQLAISYYDRHQAGSLMSRVAYDSEVLQGLLHQLTGGFLLQILQLVGVGGMLVWLNPKLAFYTLIPVPLVVLGTVYFWKRVYPKYYRLWDSSAKQIASLSGMLSGIRIVKSFAQENREFEKYDRASTYLRDSRLWVDSATSFYSATMQLVFSLGGLIVWYVGGRDVIGQEMTLGELIAFLAYLAMFYAPLATLSTFTTWLTSFLTGSKRILELLDSPVTIGESENPETAGELKGEIRFENVSFGYDRNQPVIHNVSFTVQPGEMIGIVGRSGSGKTTMINLLGRFYDVQEGRILVDGVDIRDYSLASYRQQLGIVFQESFMFRGTIWENLTYGNSNASHREALQAAKAAGAHDFICRSNLAYETPLGESGAGLSGGEKQRLSIARTLLYDPRILVLDEATSNIDAEAEKAFQQSLEVLIRGRTTIAIAHRLSTLRNADRIIVFDRGKLIEQGSHAELLNQNGTYARLVKLQTQISKDPSVDKLVVLESEVPKSDDLMDSSDSVPTAQADSMVPERVGLAQANFLNWLRPENTIFNRDDFGGLNAKVIDQEDSTGATKIFSALFAVSCFPASGQEKFISVRTWAEHDEEIEVGMIEDLSDWPSAQQELIRQSLSERYLLPQIQSIESIQLVGGYLDFQVQTDHGSKSFVLRWSHNQAQDYGENGRMLIDTDGNLFVISDLARLSNRERELFQRFIYW